MKLNKILIALGLAGAFAGVAHAATPAEKTVTKSITLTAQINDAIFVSKPDGSTWYGTEELEPADYRQLTFSKTLPIRIFSKTAGINVKLSQPLKMSNGHLEMTNAQVILTHAAGDQVLAYDKPNKITQVVQGNGGFDEIHNLEISVDSPQQTNGQPTNGSYSGNLVMLFEPAP
ncbi:MULTISPECIES: fimbrial assembly protein [Achromobacter]|jgi:hypothetical protein|uniref:Fimbrial assembly protein n=1 Tax=Alcaligenes xylosoxydans xylosoxydans TaxID=85698 RepID=A0A424WCF7_ALCXX|nr:MULTISPECIES: fimbrial assembly protein [Achromobacter]MBC9908008.1 fimbrial assembly protein [Achromobacter xylosoxidans]MBD0866705.1 fimbrial assembly protein [Achromobacter xylosoxidans]MDH1299987.1 fimbrial assembly protein [Achromobacter sp. GD03932]QNP84931.1 fimbrial assembly protein [Achromobacter xylosoxidans]RPJ90997.1 fimbrial assembly protein [Achromobacter xylosoxidans]